MPSFATIITTSGVETPTIVIIIVNAITIRGLLLASERVTRELGGQKTSDRTRIFWIWPAIFLLSSSPSSWVTTAGSLGSCVNGRHCFKIASCHLKSTWPALLDTSARLSSATTIAVPSESPAGWPANWRTHTSARSTESALTCFSSASILTERAATPI